MYIAWKLWGKKSCLMLVKNIYQPNDDSPKCALLQSNAYKKTWSGVTRTSFFWLNHSMSLVYFNGTFYSDAIFQYTHKHWCPHHHQYPHAKSHTQQRRFFTKKVRVLYRSSKSKQKWLQPSIVAGNMQPYSHITLEWSKRWVKCSFHIMKYRYRWIFVLLDTYSQESIFEHQFYES